MTRWLITTSADADLEQVRRVVEASGGTVGDEPPVPLGTDEQVVEAEGPEGLRAPLCDLPGVLKVSPDTPKHPYG